MKTNKRAITMQSCTTNYLNKSPLPTSFPKNENNKNNGKLTEEVDERSDEQCD